MLGFSAFKSLNHSNSIKYIYFKFNLKVNILDVFTDNNSHILIK